MMSRERLGEVLPHGWWPIQWLRIAYVLWVDQAWYWRHIRPHLPGRRQGWGILVQVTLGTLTAVLLLSGAAGAILERAGVCVYWDQWLPTAGMMVGLVVAIGIGRTLLGRVARGVPTIAHLGVPLGAPATVALMLDASFSLRGRAWGEGLTRDSALNLAPALGLGLLLGAIRRRRARSRASVGGAAR